ncbi:MAG: potassium channel protein [Planctomycetes bacterium]|nr:potassium channel protein [Planctomycetota bacterium]
MLSFFRQRIYRALLVILGVVAIGTFGFYFLLDDLSLMHTFYLTVITLATIGYGDINPIDNMPADGNPYLVMGFTVFLAILGLSTFFYSIGIVTEYIISGEMAIQRREKRMQTRINKLNHHYIICGCGETGAYAAEELAKTGRDFVMLEISKDRLWELIKLYDNLHYVRGDATHDDNLEAAGLARCAGIILSLPDEKENLFMVVSLNLYRREHKKDFRIAASVEHGETTGFKLKQAGADVVICPDFLSGRRMLSEMFRPKIRSFLDRMVFDKRAVMRVEEAPIPTGSPFSGLTLRDAKIGQMTGLVVIALFKGETNSFIFSPKADTVIEVGDALIAMGDMVQIQQLRRMAQA